MARHQTQYLEIVFKALPRSIEPALSSFLFRHGCWGTQEKLAFLQADLRYEPVIKSRKFITISSYFEPSAREGVEGPILTWLKEHSPATEISWHVQPNQDWLKEWKKHFKPFSVAGLKIVPAWQAKKIKGDIVIEPGMAFGTGTHATTRFALEGLRKLQTSGALPGATVLDVGAGSGILSVAAERMGATQILAMDIDPESWRECRKTFKLNKTKRCKVSESSLGRISKKFDVVLANIIDGVLMELKPQLWEKTKPGGFILLSGILTVGARAFERGFLRGKSGQVIFRVADDEWTSLIISK